MFRIFARLRQTGNRLLSSITPNAAATLGKPKLQKPLSKKILVATSSTAATAVAASGASYLVHQALAKINGTSEFSEHTKKQHKKHWLTGMHEPFITQNKEALELFHQHFGQYKHLLPESAEKLAKQHAIYTPVRIKSLKDLKDFPIPKDFSSYPLLAVGGPPALMAAIAEIENTERNVSDNIKETEENLRVIYLNDGRRFPIDNGSAWHIEQDGDAEAPTSYKPSTFMLNQVKRALYKRESYEEIERTGLYPWRTLDLLGYLKHPVQWPAALSVAADFELRSLRTQAEKDAEMNKVVSECQANENFYDTLNKTLGGKLLLPGKGGIIVARNKEELEDLYTQQKNLTKEGRSFNILSKEEMIKRYGFAFEGIGFAEKTHDRVLSPEYRKLLTTHIQHKGGKIIDGTLATIYTDGENKGGVAEYKKDGKSVFVPFKRAVMSLGNQEIRDINNKPVFDVIGAAGSSGLALVRTPVDHTLPRVFICGGTNHVSVLSENPIPTTYNGQAMHLHLIRFTAGACITPVRRGKEGGYHDSTISLGLVSSVSNTLGKDCIVEPIALYGCTRVVSKHGQISRKSPHPGIDVYFGMGGGGLTRAPNDVANSLSSSKTKGLTSIQTGELGTLEQAKVLAFSNAANKANMANTAKRVNTPNVATFEAVGNTAIAETAAAAVLKSTTAFSAKTVVELPSQSCCTNRAGG